jgi:uncharacterized protein involved in exopolysaccharide biosynthesis
MDLQDPRPDENALLDWTNALLRHRLLIVLLTIGAALAAYAVCRQAQPLYQSQAKFIPNRASQVSLKELFGANLPETFADMSDRYSIALAATYYAELMSSDPVLRPLARREWVDGRTLAQFYNLTPGPDRSTDEKAIALLRNRLVEIEPGGAAGLVTVRATTTHPELSAALANGLIAETERFLQQSMTSGTVELLRLAEDRTSQAQKALQEARQTLFDFRRTNRTRDSAELQLREEQLQTEVELQQTLYIKLKSQVALLRLSEEQFLDPIDVIQAARVPSGPSWPPTKAAVAGAAFFGLLIAVTLAFVRNGVARLAARDAPGCEEFVRHIRSLNWFLPGLIFLLPADVRRRFRKHKPEAR